MNNILVVGATNQIGNFLLPLLNDHNVFALSRKKHQNSNTITWIQGDLKNLAQTNIEKLSITTVIYIGLISLSEDLFSKLPNLQRVIAFSSTSALTKIDSSSTEDRTLAQSLLKGEEILMAYCASHKIGLTIFRPTLIYGAQRDKNVNFITEFIKKYHFFPLLGEAKGLRQPVHAHDLALAVINSLNNENSVGKIYNLTGAETLSYYDMVLRIFDSIGKKPRIIKIPHKVFYLLVKILKIIPKYRHLTTGMIDRLNQNLCFDMSEAQKDLNYNPKPFIPNKDFNYAI